MQFFDVPDFINLTRANICLNQTPNDWLNFQHHICYATYVYEVEDQLLFIHPWV